MATVLFLTFRKARFLTRASKQMALSCLKDEKREWRREKGSLLKILGRQTRTNGQVFSCNTRTPGWSSVWNWKNRGDLAVLDRNRNQPDFASELIFVDSASQFVLVAAIDEKTANLPWALHAKHGHGRWLSCVVVAFRFFLGSFSAMSVDSFFLAKSKVESRDRQNRIERETLCGGGDCDTNLKWRHVLLISNTHQNKRVKKERTLFVFIE